MFDTILLIGSGALLASALIYVIKYPWRALALVNLPKYRKNYKENAYVKENAFIGQPPRSVTIPSYADVKDQLPQPIWEGHEDAIRCYDKAWQIAFENIHNPGENSGMISPYMDAAFNDHLFMWDSCFMLMFGRYAAKLFPFQETLDNFYALQHADGFICREIAEKDGKDIFAPYDHCSTGPNVMPWCEYEHYQFHGDVDRVKRVFPALLAYHQWLRANRTWPHGGYWANGWSCGMDNMPRLKNKNLLASYFSNGHMIWADISMQQLLSCNVLIDMAKLCGRSQDVADLEAERNQLRALINEKLWDDHTNFYYDLWANGKHSGVKSIGAYWALMAQAVPQKHLSAFVAHLSDPKEFNRPNRIPTLSADNEFYCRDGNYWRGAIWAPTNYMVLKGLETYGCNDLAFEIATCALDNVVQTFCETGTLFENYAPEYAGKGNIAKGDFVGWSGIFPICTLLEFVFGLKWNGWRKELVWNVSLTDRFGVDRFPLGNHGTAKILCHKRENTQDRPQIEISSDMDFTLILQWNGHEEKIQIQAN